MSGQLRPQRIQQRRVKGADIHAEGLVLNGLPTKSVARPAKWRNRFEVEDYGRPEAIRLHCESVAGRHAEIRHDLRGYNLACFCRPDQACHADLLLAIANREEVA